MGMNKGPESRSLSQSALNHIMRYLVGYFRQYEVRKNLQEMEVKFYQKTNRNEQAFMHHFSKY